ncbi:hypothetical protein E2C01_042288 [Portunus trituberculatus]|uniref:Uncharacterized protein n=1 Tax=Portunus trituberculatus TaxID=210409 RepID=A0A5B7FW33_PORTR|nr:hypothetical protein [Portunus trituberculatus]
MSCTRVMRVMRVMQVVVVTVVKLVKVLAINVVVTFVFGEGDFNHHHHHFLPPPPQHTPVAPAPIQPRHKHPPQSPHTTHFNHHLSPH